MESTFSAPWNCAALLKKKQLLVWGGGRGRNPVFSRENSSIIQEEMMGVEAVWIWGMPPGVGPGAGWWDRSPFQGHFSPILSPFSLFLLLFPSHRSRIFLPALGLRCPGVFRG